MSREAGPKRVESDEISFPPLTPSVQGEKCGVSTRRFADSSALQPLSIALPSAAQAVETEDFVAAYHDPILCAIMSDHPLSTQDMRDIKDWTVAQQNCVGVGSQRVNKHMRSFSGVGLGGDRSVHDFVRAGVGGSGDSSRVGSENDSFSQEVSQDVRGIVSRVSHMNMFRLLVEDRRSMFYGESPKLIHSVEEADIQLIRRVRW